MKAMWEGVSGILMGFLAAWPLWLVKVFVIAIFVGLAAWALSLPRAYALAGAPDRRWWRDVRFWAALVIALEIIPYLVF